MVPRLTFCRFAFVALSALAAAEAGAQVAARSPFMPPQTAASKSGPTEGAPLEYHGFIQTGNDVRYRIYNPAKKAATWVKIDERNPDFDVVAKQHDGEHKTLTIEHAGRTLTLAERKSKIVSSGNVAQAMPPPPQLTQPTVAPAVTQSVVLNPTPADEQRRLEVVAAEVARRRALREQATQQINQGGAPQVVIPQPQAMQPQAMPPQQRNLQQLPQGNYRGDPNSGRGGGVTSGPRQQR